MRLRIHCSSNYEFQSTFWTQITKDGYITAESVDTVPEVRQGASNKQREKRDLSIGYNDKFGFCWTFP